jgi:primosomal protein N' (replication factor Y)
MTSGAYIEVAVPTPLFQTFTYALPDGVPPAPGCRVVVPFGRQKMVGVVVSASLQPPAGLDPLRLKAVLEIVDEDALFSESLLKLARWMATYYYHPIGEVLRAMLPAGVKKSVVRTLVLTESGQAAAHLDPLLADVFAAKKARKSLSLPVLKKKLRDAGQDPSLAIDAWEKQGWVTLSENKKVAGRKVDQWCGGDKAALQLPASGIGLTSIPTLTATQIAAVDAISSRGLTAPHPQKPFLLLGVTGSGKTEVYLRLIERCLAEGSDTQALLMVPEIALTPQMTRVFEARFPGLVAVVHSAMLDSARWNQLRRIRSGEARILIGPRSSVFAAFKKLRLVMVDEEHDSSYKQATGLTYNGRDVAIMRCRMEQATVVLGSATPSLETFHNATSGRYELVELPERVSGKPLPEIVAIQCNPAWKTGTVVPRPGTASMTSGPVLQMDQRVVEALRENLRAGNQSIVLVNRRGYAYYLFSLEQRAAVQCPNCSISLTVHGKVAPGAATRGAGARLRCHYCDYSTTVDAIMTKSPSDTFFTVGYGSERAEEAIQSVIPEARIMRLDSDTVSDRELLPETLNKFRNREVDILVGTQILAKGHDFPAVTLVIIIEVDQTLSLPDFRAGERTFQLIVQAAGRAGRAGLPGRVMIQSARFAHPVVQMALAQDFKGFAERELEFRKTYGYPPFSRMISVELSSENPRKLDQAAARIDSWIETAAAGNPDLFGKVKVLGPTVPAIETVRGRHRRTVLLVSYHPEAAREILSGLTAATADFTADVRVRVDVDPQSLM